jgi:hypothetical protein
MSMTSEDAVHARVASRRATAAEGRDLAWRPSETRPSAALRSGSARLLPGQALPQNCRLIAGLPEPVATR